MALKGNLKDFSTTQLLNLIHLARKTGALTIQVPSGVTTLFFREGKLVYTTMSGRDGHLASVLARAGKLSEEHAKIIRARAGTQSDKELGMLLISAGQVTQPDIVSSIRADILDTVYGLFTWTDGLFHFEPNQLPSDDAITVSINLENIILRHCFCLPTQKLNTLLSFVILVSLQKLKSCLSIRLKIRMKNLHNLIGNLAICVMV